MNESLVRYLSAIDVRLLENLDGGGELSVDVVAWLRRCTDALLDGSMQPTALADDRPDWYLLTAAFVTAYAPEEVEELEGQAEFLDAVARAGDVVLTEADRAYLWALRLQLGIYPELRAAQS